MDTSKKVWTTATRGIDPQKWSKTLSSAMFIDNKVLFTLTFWALVAVKLQDPQTTIETVALVPFLILVPIIQIAYTGSD